MITQDIAFMWGSNLGEALLINSHVYDKSSILGIFLRIITRVLKICLIEVLIFFECLKKVKSIKDIFSLPFRYCFLLI